MALSFILELVMLAALGYWGFNTGDAAITKIGLGIGVPVLVASVWGIWLAPKSSRRLREPFHLGLELIIFCLAILALGAAGQPNLAIIFGIIYAINVVLRYVVR
ncbi:MAG: YrdB family protein [Chloroflexi bacterium]|nr:YrdB family protein [Chloroflexota bacterium]